MKVGKQHIYDLPVNDITSLGSLAQLLEQEAKARGEVLPPAVRLQIGEPSFRTPEHIRMAAYQSIEREPLIRCRTRADSDRSGRNGCDSGGADGDGWAW
ncbi:MAG: hypothetical protein E6J48_04975 [Chloroflexi bacterium]|nr:MAG: hypothetical protein E6J48_04975 [Chloroflexota bacterium]